MENQEVQEFCRNKQTGKIVEVQRLHDCVLTRPVNPALYYDIKQHEPETFDKEYEKFDGSLELVTGWLKEQMSNNITIH